MGRRVARLAGLALVAAATGCAHAPDARGPVSAPGGWRELRSLHFVLRTDLPSAAARAALAGFERSQAAFAQVLFPSEPQPALAAPTALVLLARREDFRALAPPEATGYFLASQSGDVDPTPTIVLQGDAPTREQRRFQHELTHRFLADRVRGAPPWLEEGLAEYYSTLRIVEDGPAAVIIGELPIAQVLATELRTYASLDERWVEQRVLLSDLPTLRELRTQGDDEFHRPATEVASYAASWLFVHLLDNPELVYRARFHRFVDGLSNGRPADAAWQAAFGDLPPGQLERDFRRYATRAELGASRALLRAPIAPVVIDERPLSAGEVRLVRARTRPWDSRENIYAAAADLDAALAERPDDPEVRYWSALHQRRRRRFAAAEGELQRAIAAAPAEDRYWLALADLLDEVAREDSAPAGQRVRVDAAVRRLLPLARSARACEFLARYYGSRGDPAAALPWARRAIEAQQWCWECRETWALLRGAPSTSPAPLPVLGRSVD